MFQNWKTFSLFTFAIPVLLVAVSFTIANGKGPQRSQPDLRIRDVKFDRSNPKVVQVVVGNAGQGIAGASKLQLTVRRIHGTSVGRQTHVKTPPLKFSESAVILIDATSILPSSVMLKDTTFRLDADSDDAVNESNETNNLVWHNL